MRYLTLYNIAVACGGILRLGEGQEALAQTEISGIVTDSRQAGKGMLFAAIKGSRVDGHDFIPQVFSQGAMCVITERDLSGQAAQTDPPYPAWIKVGSTLQALKDIAEYYLQELSIPVVGITGSVGKTSTKEMIAAVLSQKYNTLKTVGNFNNELGLPLTVFRLREEHEIAVLEMGISAFGEMHRLAKIARPDTCVITNIGDCHLEFLHDRDGVLRAKTEIFDFLEEDGHIILNGNDERLRRVREVKGIHPVFFGIPDEADHGTDGENGDEICRKTGGRKDDETGRFDLWADEIRPGGLKGIYCRIHTPQGAFSALVPIPGRHMVMNALAGTAVGLTYGLTLEEIRQGIESLEPVSGRFHIIETGRYTVIDDCYNANPMSMKASLEVLQSADTRKVAILGDMFELGEEEEAMHRQVGTAAAHGADLLIGIGPRSAALVEQARMENPDLQAVHYDRLEDFLNETAADEAVTDKAASNEAASETALRTNAVLLPGDTILVKASHGMEFARIVSALTAEKER